MVYAQFEGAQLRPSESGNSSQSDSVSAKMLFEAQSYQVLDQPLTHARGAAAVGSGDNRGTETTDKEIDKIINGFAIKSEDAAADKSAIACRMMKGQTIEFGRIVLTDKNGDGKAQLGPGRDRPDREGPTDQDRATRFELYLWRLCNRRK